MQFGENSRPDVSGISGDFCRDLIFPELERSSTALILLIIKNDVKQVLVAGILCKINQ